MAVTRVLISLKEPVEFLRQTTFVRFDTHQFLKLMIAEIFDMTSSERHLQFLLHAGMDENRARWMALKAFNMVVDTLSEFFPKMYFCRQAVDSMEFVNDFDLMILPRTE